jgi:hypothetical protein
VKNMEELLQDISNPVETQARCSDSKSDGHLCPIEKTVVNFRSAELVQAARDDSRKSQRARILGLLLDAHGAWVPLPEILELHISQFGARIFELRRLGFLVENKIQRDDSGTVHSSYRLVTGPASAKPEPVKREVEWKDQPGLTGLPLFDLAVSR